MPPRLYIDRPLRVDADFALPAGPARHVQVLRLQPGAALALFDGGGAEWSATVLRIGRSEVQVSIDACREVDRELPLHVTLAIGMPANERMDALVEKASELGVVAIQPLLCERSVLRLSGERAQKKVAHWQAVAQAACEQCGRTRLPRVEPVRTVQSWLAELPAGGQARWLLAPGATRPVGALTTPASAGVLCLSGPEGGFTPDEVAAAGRAGFEAVALGPRILRADTAPLALLAYLALAAA